MIDKSFWKGRKVFVTGHTGFKGSWLSLWLSTMGAIVTGYALDPPTEPSLFVRAGLKNHLHRDIRGDVRDLEKITKALKESGAEIVIHMAAQPLVRLSYDNPVLTYSTNVMGTVNLFEAVRHAGNVRVVVNITTDKCYENREWYWGYRENEPMGGYDPYSSSKGCSELVTAAYRSSFFNTSSLNQTHFTAVASARAGNVIGGGDYAADRLIPDIIRGLIREETIIIRNPGAIRPWQHVLDPLSGYLLLCENLYHSGSQFAEAWNFGPVQSDTRTVEWIAQKLCSLWGPSAGYKIVSDPDQPHEAMFLKLDISKANQKLNWYPRWSLSKALEEIVVWNQAADFEKVSIQQINAYMKS